MKFLSKAKDGGPKSRVTGYWLVEIKPLFSVVLLRFDDGTRPAWHDHAFNSVSWLLTGHLREKLLKQGEQMGAYHDRYHWPSIRPILTRRRDLHQVASHGTSWVLSFRGPWARTWHERTESGSFVTLSHGRKLVGS